MIILFDQNEQTHYQSLNNLQLISSRGNYVISNARLNTSIIIIALSIVVIFYIIAAATSFWNEQRYQTLNVKNDLVFDVYGRIFRRGVILSYVKHFTKAFYQDYRLQMRPIYWGITSRWCGIKRRTGRPEQTSRRFADLHTQFGREICISNKRQSVQRR